ncbi:MULTISPECIES: ABC transporter ATP-binding protein [Pseudofrankia]|uniref:ABC transporter ATP-binding protein n=1 Tax=Pseudofrankia TaxID=2994363 RepID=UPI000234D8F4|nr:MULTISPECIES: sn-glycerol-3-phosphate ABC transporter ATP-binding protein UgpC [Pseudofrankia]OHV35016.1 sugar ABC transporter ATP-binding protein [Pseudofrankia sp. EUN1h]
MATVEFAEATRVYPGADRPAVDAFELQIADGEFLVLVGPSGCGKSTALRMIAGLEPVDAGRIRIGERDVTDLPPGSRDIAMVFQNYALYPHLSVAGNLGFALKAAGVAKEERTRRIRATAALLDLEPYLDRKPRMLSGGQRQRVAMGRAIVREPQVFLMDEPLSNLDAKLRVSTRGQIASLQRRLGVTTAYVTHDQVEAMTMGDRVAVLREGQLCQVGTPLALYERPETVFVAGFIGSPAMNLIEARLEDGRARLGETVIPLPRATARAAADEGATAVTVGFRPEALELRGDGEGFAVTVDLVEELGADAYLYGTAVAPGAGGRIDAPSTVTVVARLAPKGVPRRGAQVRLRIRHDAFHVFSTKTGRRLPD